MDKWALYFSLKKYVPHLDQANPLKGKHVYSEFIQYMLVRSCVNVGTYFYTKNNEESPFVYLHSEVLSAFCML